MRSPCSRVLSTAMWTRLFEITNCDLKDQRFAHLWCNAGVGRSLSRVNSSKGSTGYDRSQAGSMALRLRQGPPLARLLLVGLVGRPGVAEGPRVL